jgi:hypothetical protein
MATSKNTKTVAIMIRMTVCFRDKGMIDESQSVHALSNISKREHPFFWKCDVFCQFCNKSNRKGATCGSGTVYPFGIPEFTPVI